MDNKDANEEATNRDIGNHIINACIQWARIKGYSDTIGFLRGLTILAKEPASLEDLKQETGCSKSTVSANMKLLEDMELVKRVVIPGDKRHLYTPIIDPEVIRANMLNAITKEMQLFCEALDRTESEILAGRDEAKYLLERIVSLKQCCELSKKTIDILRKQSLNKMQKSQESDSEQLKL